MTHPQGDPRFPGPGMGASPTPPVAPTQGWNSAAPQPPQSTPWTPASGHPSAPNPGIAPAGAPSPGPYGVPGPQFLPGQPGPAAPQGWMAPTPQGWQVPPPPPVAATKRRTWLPWLIGFLVLAVIAAVATAVVVLQRGRTPKEAMLAYAQALSDGDAARARALTTLTPDEAPLFNQKTLDSMKAHGRLPKLLDSKSCSRCVIMDIGGKTVTFSWDTQKVGKDAVIGNGIVRVPVSGVPAGMTVTLEGQPLSGGSVELPYGVYEIAGTHPYLEAKPTTTTVAPFTLNGIRLSTSLSTAGQQAAQTAVRASFDQCLAQQSLAPAGCPFKYMEDVEYALVPSTIQWSLVGAHPAETLTLDYDEGSSRATAPVTFSLHLKATAKERAGSREGILDADQKPISTTATFDLTKTPMTVTWR